MNGPHLCAPTIKIQANLQNRAKKNQILVSSSHSSKHIALFSSTSSAADEGGGGPVKKPRVGLRFVWMEKNIGVAVDRVLPDYGSVPLSPYYWWPRTDAWEELKSKLEEKNWIPEKEHIVLLNQATDIINLWQQTNGKYLYG